ARQSLKVTSQAARGDMVIGAMPIPAETSETARLLCVSNQPVTQAIIGAKTAATATPATRPKTNWKASSDVVRLAANRLVANSSEPATTTGGGPQQTERPPHNMLAKAMERKPMVMAVEIPVTDQPVSLAIGNRKTGSENMAPTAMQPMRPPAATITQR